MTTPQLKGRTGPLRTNRPENPLSSIEPRLRALLPADLYAAAWVNPSPDTLVKVFEHLRTLQRIMFDYVPRQVAESQPQPGEERHEWQEGTLMFTDLAGFTPLMEANAARGKDGAKALLGTLTTYFSEILEIASKSGGNLLEFTGDAMLIQFPPGERLNHTALAVRAGLRMQRAMFKFSNIETDQGVFSLGMRIGIHTGRIFTADIGTPRRMEHVLLGNAVQRAKQAEGAGERGRVNVTIDAYEPIKDLFHFEEGNPGHMLVVDDLSKTQLGEFEIAATGRRLASAVLFDRSVEALVTEIERGVQVVEPLSAYIPDPVLNLLVENAAKREVPSDFVYPTVLFVALIGLPEAVDQATEAEQPGIVSAFSEIFSLINAAVEARGGVLKKVTYHLAGSDIMIFFGVPTGHTDDAARAAEAAIAIREIIASFDTPVVGGKKVEISCQIGLSRGPCFAAEIGEPRGRREFNVLGDTVNTAARLMGRAVGNRIMVTEWVQEEVKDRFQCDPLGSMTLKGKEKRISIFALEKEGVAPEAEAKAAPASDEADMFKDLKAKSQRLKRAKLQSGVDGQEPQTEGQGRKRNDKAAKKGR